MQIAEYVRGRQRIVEHVGSAHTEAELGMLLERARELLDNPAQGVLDLGVEPTPPVKGLVASAGDPGLFTGPDAVTSAGRDGPGRVVGTDSRILLDALAGVFTALGFDGLDDEEFRDLGQSAASYATMKHPRLRPRASSATVSRPGASSTPAPAGTFPWCSTTSARFISRREGRRAAQGRVFQGTPGRSADRRRSVGGPGRVPAGDRLL